MPTTINRGVDITGNPTPITVTSSASAGFSMAGAAGALVIVVAVRSGATKLTFRVKISQASTDTPATLVGSTGTTVEQTIAANQVFDLPPGLFAAPWVMPVCDAGEADIRVVAKT